MIEIGNEGHQATQISGPRHSKGPSPQPSFLLFLLLLFVFHLVVGEEGAPQSRTVDKPSESQVVTEKMLQPMGTTPELRLHMITAGRRKLETFHTCAPCKCCPQFSEENCVWMKCCYGIQCDLPNKPFGYCAF
ncbi:unnamed protein product, partial [Cuscuta epithymum]